MGHNRDAGTDHGDRVTYVQAAGILGVHVSNVPKLVRRGELTSSGRRGHGAALVRAEVDQLASERRAAAAARAERRAARAAARSRPQQDRRPDLEHDWLTSEQTAAIVGITSQAILKRLRKGTMPGIRHRGQWWIRAEHARLAANARVTRQARVVVGSVRRASG